MEKIWIDLTPETRVRDGITQVAVWKHQIPDLIDEIFDAAGIDCAIEYFDDDDEDE